MKKYLFCIIITLALSQSGFGQDLNQLLKKVSETENIEKVKIGRFLMTIGKAFGDVNDMPVAKGIHSMEVYTLSDCSHEFKKDFSKQFNSIKDGNGYETLIYAKDKKDAVRIMIKKQKNIIREMVILCMDESEPTIVKFSGKIQENDIAELIKKYDK